MPFKLQSTFSYGDDVPPPIDYVRVGVSFPQFAVHTDDAGNSSLSEVGTEYSAFSQEVLSRQYWTSISLYQVFGSDYGNALAAYMGTLLSFGRKPSLRNLSIGFDFNFGENKQDRVRLNAIFFANSLWYFLPSLSSAQPSAALTSADSVSRTVHSSSSQSETEPVFVQSAIRGDSQVGNRTTDKWLQSEDPDTVVDSVMYIVNRDEYFSLLDKIFPSIAPEDSSILLYLINPLVDLTGTSPALVLGVEDLQREVFDQQVADFGLSTSATAFDTVLENFSKLFDFPLHLPEIERFSLAGTVTILAPAPMQISASQASFYHLSAEYLIDPGYNSEDYPSLHVGRYPWTPAMAPQNNVINFSFSENVARSRVTGLVSVKLKAFDGSTMYDAKFSASDPLLQQLDITVDLRLPSQLGSNNDTGFPGSSGIKIPGQLVSLSKRCSLKAVVVIQVKILSTDVEWLTVSSTTSDEQGNFALPYPYGKYETGQVLVSIDPGHSTPLAMIPSATSSVPSSFMYVLLNDPPPTDAAENVTSNVKDGCSCDPTTTAGRLPAHEDLINNSQYMQDLGGGCINLLTPNRTLREYNYSALVRSSDPDVANYTLSSYTNPDDLSVSYQLTLGAKINRSLIDLDNAIQWQDVSEIQSDSVLYQACTVASGHVLYYKSEFRSDGYSLGSLLYSLPLAPGQKKEIVTIEARHSLRGSESQSVAQSEQLAHELVNSRDIVDSIAGNIGEALRGSSSASTEGVSAGVGLSGSVGVFGGSLGVAGGYSSSSSSASQNSNRNLGSHFSEVLRQGTVQNSSNYRALNSTVITSVNEGMSETAQSSVVANHNHCHSLTMMYFEVLQHFAVFQELVDVEECIFVPFLMTKFTMENIYKWSDVLVTKLLPLSSNTYLKPATFFSGRPTHPLIPAFDALERVKTNWALVDYPLTTYDDEVIDSIQGTMTLNVNIARPNTKYDFIKSLPIITKQVSSTSTNAGDIAKSVVLGVLTGGLSFLGGSSASHTTYTTVQARAQIFDAFMQMDANYQSVPPASCIRIVNFNAFPLSSLFGIFDDGSDPVIDPFSFFFGSTVDQSMWVAYAAILGYDNSVSGALLMLTYYFKGQLISEWDSIWSNSIAPLIYIKMSESLAIESANVTFTPLGRYGGGERQMTVSFIGTLHMKRNAITSMTVLTQSANVQALHGTSTVFILGNTRIAYSTPHYNGLLFSGYPNEDLTNPFTILFTPETAAEKRNPRNDDRYLASRLIVHLNQNLEYYNRSLWLSLDPQRRFLLLDGFNLEVFDQQGVSVGFRSISSIVKSNVLGVAGNSLVFPVAPGYKVSQNYVYVTDSSGAQVAESLLDYYKPNNPTPPYRLSVPTKGVYSEALMGACDSCEPVKADSSQDWVKFNTDDAPVVNPVQPALPTFTAYNPTVKDLGTPSITIQNAPAAPDPGAGLAAATALLGKADIFSNITGLDQTQKAALQTLITNTDSAKAFASMAGGLAQQGHNTANSSQILETMKQARQDGALTQDDYTGLVKSHFQQQIDGGTTLKANLDEKKAAAKPTLSDAAVAAASTGQNVSAVTTDGTGASESLQVSGLGQGVASNVVLAEVTPEPTALHQPSNVLCWATTLAMMLQWKKNASFTPRDAVATSTDPHWLKLYDAPSGLPFGELAAFYKAYDMVAEPAQSVGPQVYVSLMKSYGPLWTNIDADPTGAVSGHAKVLIKITGDGSITHTDFTSIDPWFGAVKTESFLQFVSSIEQLAQEPNMVTGFQVLHFKDKLPTTGTP